MKKGATETFGERLRRLRETHGFTAVDLAKAVSASEGTIRQLEAGNVKSPSFALGLRLATTLKVDPNYLAFGETDSVHERIAALEKQVASMLKRVKALEH